MDYLSFSQGSDSINKESTTKNVFFLKFQCNKTQSRVKVENKNGENL